MTPRLLSLLGCAAALLTLPFWALGRNASPQAPPEAGQPAPLAAPNRPVPGGAQLISELGCGACHAGVPAPDGMAERAPALDHAGLRYRPEHLYAYLRSPTRVRRHIGAARMPDFRLDERESLALTLYLGTLREDGDRPDLPRRWLPRPGGAPDPTEVESLIRRQWGCTGCHSLNGAGGSSAPELADAGARLNPEWIRRFLVAPHRWEPATPMPPRFFSDSSGVLRERMPDAARRVEQATAYLGGLGVERRRALERDYRVALERYPEVDAGLGRALFLSLNCAGCHTRAPARGWRNAPDLSREGSRVRADWLRAYLASPTPIRPFGFYPGSGSRMPDFRLSPEEADSIHAYLTRSASAPVAAPNRPALSAFAAAKAETLLRERLPCLGCHTLDGEGGRIGPDLSAAGGRLRPEWLRSMIHDPQRTVPGTAMPRTAMPDETRELITTYLMQRRADTPGTRYLSPADHPLLLPRAGPTEARRYLRYCAACHGETGGGDGYNARFLPTPPTQHADAGYLGQRPDDVLFDGIHAGGAVLDRSPRMPGFGQTLGNAETRGLVAYLRTLCDCDGPAWSRDGARPGGSR